MTDSNFDVYKYVRRLAKGNRYQSLFSLGKELRFQLLDNDCDFSSIQLTFIGYIAMYNNMYTDIALGDVNKIVLDSEIYEDAYNYYKSKYKYSDRHKQTNEFEERRKNLPANREEIVGRRSQWIFKSPKKK